MLSLMIFAGNPVLIPVPLRTTPCSHEGCLFFNDLFQMFQPLSKIFIETELIVNNQIPTLKLHFVRNMLYYDVCSSWLPRHSIFLESV